MRIVKNNKKRGAMLYDNMGGCRLEALETCGQRPLRSSFECLRMTPVLSIVIVIFCLFLSANTLAQSSDTSHKDKNGVVVREAPFVSHPKPMIILDDKVFKGSLGQIDPNSIIDVKVLKGESATALYGAKAVNGVVIIRTKNYKNIDTTHRGKLLDSVVIRIK